MVSPRYLPIIGGAEVQCNRLVNELQHRFSEEIVVSNLITRKFNNDLKKSEIINGLQVTRFGFSGMGIIKEYFFCIHLFFYLLFNINKFDVLHCHATGIFGLTCSLFGTFFRKKILLKISTNGELASLSKSYFKYFFSTILFKNSTLIALNDQGMREAKAFFPEAKVLLVPNGISEVVLELYEEEKNKIRRGIVSTFGENVRIGVFVGRFVERKGIKIIDDLAIGPFLDKENIVLLLVGDDSNQRDGYKLKNNNKRVIQVGLQNDVYPYLLVSDFFFSPSHYEGLPNTVLEALVVKKFCLLSSIDPHVELFDDNKEMIKLFNVNDLKDFQSCLSSVDTANIPSIEINPKFSIVNVASKYRDIYMGE